MVTLAQNDVVFSEQQAVEMFYNKVDRMIMFRGNVIGVY